MLRKKKGSELQGGDDKTESTREDAEENWEVLTVADAMQNEGQEQKRLPTPEDIKANMAAGNYVIGDPLLSFIAHPLSLQPLPISCISLHALACLQANAANLFVCLFVCFLGLTISVCVCRTQNYKTFCSRQKLHL